MNFEKKGEREKMEEEEGWTTGQLLVSVNVNASALSFLLFQGLVSSCRRFLLLLSFQLQILIT